MKGLFKNCKSGGPICDSAPVNSYLTATQTAVITYLTVVRLGDPPVTEIQNTQQKSKHERASITEMS